MNLLAFSGAVANGSNYKSRIAFSGEKAQVFGITYKTTDGGSLAGTLYVQGSDSQPYLLEQDKAGGVGYTDKATWVNYTGLKNSSGTPVASISVSGAVTDRIDLKNFCGSAMRCYFVPSAGSGTLEITITSRRA